MAATLEERVKQARKELRAHLRDNCATTVSNTVVDATEAFLWEASLDVQSKSSYKSLKELPDGDTLTLYKTRSVNKAILNEAVLRAMVHELEIKAEEYGSIAQRVRARSRGRNSTVPQTTVEAGSKVKGQGSEFMYAAAAAVFVLLIVVYVVESLKHILDDQLRESLKQLIDVTIKSLYTPCILFEKVTQMSATTRQCCYRCWAIPEKVVAVSTTAPRSTMVQVCVWQENINSAVRL